MKNLQLITDFHRQQTGVEVKFVSIKNILGHRSSKTIDIFTHVSQPMLKRVKSPIGRILKNNKSDISELVLNYSS